MPSAIAPQTDPDAAPAAAWRAYQSAGTDKADEEELITRYLPLVRNVVDRIKLNLPSHVDADDLYSVGVTGLLGAVRKYDPEQGKTFAAYAMMRIRGAILDELRRLDWCPRRIRARARQLKDAIDTVEQRVGRAATDEEMCTELGLTPKEYAHWLDETKPVTFITLDEPVHGAHGDGTTIHELLQDENDVTGRDNLEKSELTEILIKRMAELPDIQRKILAMYYFENLRMAEIAAAFGLTESRICQIHTQIILGLRAYLARARQR
ncbi:MAG TPA: FliA/WhiG family RNA polymerase sigma factor [Opitutus sp.]|nr:FliA/WhiG family RNA polymerase sigma factor [Opitutus sp.]